MRKRVRRGGERRHTVGGRQRLSNTFQSREREDPARSRRFMMSEKTKARGKKARNERMEGEKGNYEEQGATR